MKSRVVLLFVGFLCLWGLLIGRSIYLQILPNSKLAQLEKRQYTKKVTLESHRGSILDRNGKELAVTISTYSLFADPKIIESPKKISRQVAKYLGLRRSQVYKKISNSKKRFVWIKRHLTERQKIDINKWKIRGLAFIEESKRIYPNEKLLSQILGFVGREGQGLEGLEMKFDSFLKGEKKQVKIQRDARGRPLVVDARHLFDHKDGADIQLTIDQELQYFMENQLEEVVAEYSAKGAIGVVLDAQSSEILAMGSVPRVNLNRPSGFSRGHRRNKSVTDFYEPGSTLKPIVAAGALREGLALPNTEYDCGGGRLRIGRRVIREADEKHSFDKLTMTEILAYSSNVGITQVAFQLGEKRTRSVLLDFGFGQRLGVDFPGEVSGILPELPWRKHQLSNISFGHAMTATALQIANAYGALANGGVLKKPFLVKSISKRGEETVELEPEVIRRVLTTEQSKMMRLMLTTVTARGGTGWRARVPGFPVGGKTGTAQKVNPNGRGYLKGAYLSSFAGFVPANDPKFVVYIVVDEPQGKYYGTTVAAPVFSKVAQFAMRRSGLAPVLISQENITEKTMEPEKTTDFNGLLQKKAIMEIQSSLKAKSEGTTPNLLGMSLRQVFKEIKGSKINIRVRGKGRVVRTWPDPGDRLPSSGKIRLQLKPD